MKKSLFLLSLFAAFGFSTISIAQVPNYVPTNGLVGWWPFNGNANDESGNGNNGTVNGATLTTDRFGNVDQAYSFDGVDDRVEINNSNSLNPTAISISGWINSQGNATNVQSGAKGIVTKWYQQINCNNNGDNYNVQLSLVNNQSVLLGSTMVNNQVTGALTTNTNIIGLGEWKHFVFIQNSIGRYIYIDGVLINSNNQSGNLCATLNKLFFGADNNLGNPWRFFNGKIDDIGIWNRALNECEIQDLYDSQLGSQLISAGANQTICNGQDVVLSASGGSNYQWDNNVIDGQVFSPIQTNNYAVQGTDSNGCTGTDSVLVTVLENSSSTLNETALGSYTLNGQTYTQSGTYTQTIPAANGCDSVITLNLTLSFTGIENEETSAFIVYPNPATKKITIDAGNLAMLNGYSIKIENNAGQQVFQSAINQEQFYVDLSSWTGNGLYFVHLIDPQNNTVIVRKIVLQ